MDLMIRHAEESDSRGLMQLHSLPSVVAGTLQLPFQPESLWLKRIKENPDSSYILLAEMDSDIVGSFGLLVASHCPRRKHSATIGMAVKDCQRNKGIGSQLLQAGLELSDNWLNVTRVELSDNWLNVTRVELMVFTDNDASIHLWAPLKIAIFASSGVSSVLESSFTPRKLRFSALASCVALPPASCSRPGGTSLLETKISNF